MTTQCLKMPTREVALSACGRYQYNYRLIWGSGDHITFLGLQPPRSRVREQSLAKKCQAIAERLRCGRMDLVNVFAYRTDNSRDLLLSGDPIGQDNNFHIEKACAQASIVVVCWGTFYPEVLQPRLQKTLPHLPAGKLRCMGLTVTKAPSRVSDVSEYASLIPYYHPLLKTAPAPTPHEISAFKRTASYKAENAPKPKKRLRNGKR